MSTTTAKALVTARPIPVRKRVCPWLRAVGREVRAALASAMPRAMPRAVVAAFDMPLGTQVTFSAHGHDSRGSDGTAGCEFVDDQIRHAD